MKNWMNREIITGVSNPHNLREKLILTLKMAPIPSLDEISLSTTPVSQINITIPMIMTLRDNTNSPRIIDYREMNRDTQSRNNNSQYGGGTQPTNISRSDRGQNNRSSNSTNQFYEDHRENEGYSGVLDNSNQYQDDRGFNSDNRNNRYTNDSNMGRQQNRASNSSTFSTRSKR